MSKSHKLLAKYLNGNKKISINMIKNQEKIDYVNFLLDKYGKNKLKRIILIIPFFIYGFYFND